MYLSRIYIESCFEGVEGGFHDYFCCSGGSRICEKGGRAGNPNAAMPRQAWKIRSAGDSDTLWGRGTVTRPTSEVNSKKQTNQKSKSKSAERGGGGAPRSIAPPPPPGSATVLGVPVCCGWRFILWGWYCTEVFLWGKQCYKIYIY